MMLDMGVGSWPHRRARIAPHKLALRQARPDGTERTLTYAQLADRVDALAGLLQSWGIRPGDRVAYLGPNDITTFEFLFATLRAGAIFVPLNTRLSPVELSYMIADCGAGALIYGDGFSATVEAMTNKPSFCVAAEEPVADAPFTPAPLEATPLEATPLEATPLEATPLEGVAIDMSAPCLILYTSGTTGTPKGAVLTHANLSFNTMNQFAHADYRESDVMLCVAPLFHVTGLGQVTLPTLFRGGTVVVVPKFDAGWLLTNVAALGINGFSAVPTMLAMLVDHPHWEAADLSSLRLVIYGGSAVSDRVARAWQARGLQVLQGYGMTEASPGVFLATPEGAQQRPVSIGVPHFFTDIAHLGPDGPIPVQPGVEAELLIQGPNVFSGYWNRPEDTEASKEGDWFRTGDVVRVEADGWGYAIDRVKDMIISGGENIYPAEVEAVLITMPQVSDCAVVAVPDERWGEVGMAMISLRPGQTLSEADVRDFLAQRLARYKVPKYFTFLESLPRNATGKILRSQLRSQARQKLT